MEEKYRRLWSDAARSERLLTRAYDIWRSWSSIANIFVTYVQQFQPLILSQTCENSCSRRTPFCSTIRQVFEDDVTYNARQLEIFQYEINTHAISSYILWLGEKANIHGEHVSIISLFYLLERVSSVFVLICTYCKTCICFL